VNGTVDDAVDDDVMADRPEDGAPVDDGAEDAPDTVQPPARRRMFGRLRPDRTEAPAPERPRTVADLVAERAAAEQAARATDAP